MVLTTLTKREIFPLAFFCTYGAPGTQRKRKDFISSLVAGAIALREMQVFGVCNAFGWNRLSIACRVAAGTYQPTRRSDEPAAGASAQSAA